MKEIILQGVVFILLVGYIFLIRFFKKNESNQRTSARLIDSMKLKCEELKLQIEQQNKEIASLLTYIPASIHNEAMLSGAWTSIAQ